MQNFRTLDLAIELYNQIQTLKFPGYLKNQILRSSSSIALNLSEGRGKNSSADQLRFFNIAMGSLRETQTALILGGHKESRTWKLADKTAAHLFLLIKRGG